MTVEHRANQLIIRDQPLGFWLFYFLFVAGGTVALILSLSVAPDTVTAIIGSIIGIGNIAGGLYMIRREPASVVFLDLGTAEVRVRRWHPIGRREHVYPLQAVSAIDVEDTEHTDGGMVYRPRLQLGSASVPVSMFWYQTVEDCERVVGEMGRFLKLLHDSLEAGGSEELD